MMEKTHDDIGPGRGSGIWVSTNTRIPAAIAKIKPFFEEYPGLPHFHAPGVTITATEVALAEEVWLVSGNLMREYPSQVLIAFTEKVESVT